MYVNQYGQPIAAPQPQPPPIAPQQQNNGIYLFFISTIDENI